MSHNVDNQKDHEPEATSTLLPVLNVPPAPRNNAPPELDVVEVCVADLKPHPLQASHFDDVTESALDALAEDMLIHGQLTPIEVLPDMTVICGHQRVRAAKKLGWESLKAIIREDLAQLGPNAVEQRLIEDNVTRRHVGTLTKLRAAKRLVEIERGGKGRHRGLPTGDTRDVIAKKAKRHFGLDMTGKTLERHLKVLDAPMEVQQAFDADRIGVMLAHRIPLLPADVQKKIAKMLKAGQNAGPFIKSQLAQLPQTNRRPRRKPIRSFIHDYQQCHDTHAKHMKNIATLNPESAAVLRKNVELLEEVLDRASIVNEADALRALFSKAS